MTATLSAPGPKETLDALREIVKELTIYIKSVGIQNFSEETKLALADFFDKVADRVSELRQIIPPEKPDIPVGAEMIWKVAGGDPKSFVSYLRTFPDPELNKLLTNPDQLNNLIEYLSRTIPPGEPAQADGIPQADLQSSNIYGFRYNSKNRRLLVRFNNGSVYGYDNVPPAIYSIFQHGAIPARTDGQNQWGKWWKGKMPSLGASFYEMIRMGNYPYQRLS